jgi:hypothetical protein
MVYAYPKCKNVLVDDYSKPYRDEVLRYLDLIATTDVGRTLYDFIGKTTKTVRITWTLGMSWTLTGASPISQADIDRIVAAAQRISRLRRIRIEDAVEAAMNEDAIITAKRRGQYAKGHPVMQAIHIAVFEALGLHADFMVPTREEGTGDGADVELDYHPAAFEEIMKKTGRVPIGMGPGEALYHELVHAQRMMAGALLNDNVPEQWNMDDFEEFCAILAANMYRSARGFTRLRLDHHVLSDRAPWRGATELPPELADSQRYFEAFKPEIVKWFNNQRGFCLALAGSCAAFNPMAVAARSLGLPVAVC